MTAVDRFQGDDNVKIALCNIIASGVGITLTAGTNVIFQDLNWVTSNAAAKVSPGEAIARMSVRCETRYTTNSSMASGRAV
jgi:hypothetical protein